MLATWRLLLDLGSLQDGEPHLAGTAHPPVARLSAATAAEIGVLDGQPVKVATDSGSVTVPLVITPMPDRVVWLPAHSAGASAAAGPRGGGGIGCPHRPREQRMSLAGLIAADASTTSPTFGDVWWISLIKVVGVFVLLVCSPCSPSGPSVAS